MTSFNLEILAGTAKVMSELDGLTDVLLQVEYRFVGTDGTYFAYRTGKAQLAHPDPNSFVDFESITETLLEQWITESEAAALSEFEAQMAAELVDTAQEAALLPKALPWEPRNFDVALN